MTARGAGMSGRGQRLLRTVSSSFPAGAVIVASPSSAQRQRSWRGSLDVLRSASCGVSKLVASTRNVTLKVRVPATAFACEHRRASRACQVQAYSFHVQGVPWGGFHATPEGCEPDVSNTLLAKRMPSIADVTVRVGHTICICTWILILHHGPQTG